MDHREVILVIRISNNMTPYVKSGTCNKEDSIGLSDPVKQLHPLVYPM